MQNTKHKTDKTSTIWTDEAG